MSLLNQIKKDNINFRKNKDQVKALLTTTLLGEIQTDLKKETKLSEEDTALAVLKRFKKSLISQDMTSEQKEELQLIESYLPEVMGEDEIRDYIKSNYAVDLEPNRMKLMGPILKDLGKAADGALVSKVLKSM